MIDDPGALADTAIAACQRAWPEVRIARERVIARLAGAPGAVIASRDSLAASSGAEGRRGSIASRDSLAASSGAEGRRGSIDHLGELCLVWACLDGDPAAQRAVERAIRAEAEGAVRALRAPAWLADEVHQEVCRRLLVGTAPRLATYAGQAVLGRWLGVAAMRTALNLVRRNRPTERLDSDLAAALPAVEDSPELAVLRERYRAPVEAALREAFEALDTPRDRNLLRMYYAERIGQERLGQLFGVHAATVSRWLASLREQLFADTRERLMLQLGMPPDELESMLRAVRVALDLTLTRILRV